MKITALGVHSAFATGDYTDAISLPSAVEIVEKLMAEKANGEVTGERIRQLLKSESQTMYRPKWHSNFLLEFDTIGKRGKRPYRLLLDAGGDIRHSLKAVGLSGSDIDGVYISHPHNDHIGGMEFLGLTTLFNPDYTPAKKKWLGDQFVVEKLFLEHDWWPKPPENAKPDLFIHRKVLEPLTRALGPGLDTVQGVPDVTLGTYFDIHLIGKQADGKTQSHTIADGDEHWVMTPLFAMHVISSSEEMASYGLSLLHSSGYNILMPTDTQHMMPPQLEAHYKRANRIYMDCETSQFPSGVHPHISELMKDMAPELQKKCLLYHYDEMPDIPEGMFYGILKAGDSHEYPQ